MVGERDSIVTIECLRHLPDDGRRYEVVRGRLVSEPRPVARHGRIAATITHLLLDYLDEHPIGEVLTCDPGFVLARSPDTLRGPDVALVLARRYPGGGDDQDWLYGAPDLAVEVLSRSDRPAAMAAKVEDYLAAGGACVWVVDPDARSVCVYRRGADPVVVQGKALLTAEPLLPGFRVPVARLFRRTAERGDDPG